MFKILKYIYLEKTDCDSPESRFLSFSGLSESVYMHKKKSYKLAKERPVILLSVASSHHKGNSYNSTGMGNCTEFYFSFTSKD